MEARTLAWQELSDPSTSPARLQEISTQYPEFRPAVLEHPNVYPELAQWIQAQVGIPTQPAAPIQPVTPVQTDTAGASVSGTNSNGYSPRYAAGQSEHAAQQPGLPAQQPDLSAQQTGLPAQQLNQAAQYPPAAANQPSYGVAPADPAYGAAYGTAYGTVSPGQNPGGYAPVTEAYVEDGSRKSKLPKILSIGAASVVLVALVGGLIFWFAIGRKIEGAASPEAAVEKLIDSVIAGDVYSLYGSIAPSEMTPALEVMDAVEARFAESDYSESLENFEQIRDALDISVTDLKFETLELGEGITRVDITGGFIKIDGDKNELKSIIIESLEQLGEGLGTNSVSGGGPSTANLPAEIELEIDEFFAESWPLEFDLGELLDETIPTEDRRWFRGVPMVTVAEGGKWYVSPLLTMGELARIGTEVSGSTGSGGYQYGTVPNAAEAASPEDAVAALASGIESFVSNGNADDMISALALPERRLIALHSGLFEGFSGTDTQVAIEPGITVISNDGTLAVFQPKDMTISVTDSYGETSTVQFNELCAGVEDPYNATTEWMCLAEGMEQALSLDEELDLSRLGLVAVNEDGNWHVSALHSYSHLAVELLELFDDEMLERLGFSAL